MKQIIAVLLFLLESVLMFGQKSSGLLEVNPYIKMDWYPAFDYSINTATTNTVKIKGMSWGLNVSYKYPINKTMQLKAGLGYFKYSFNDISQVNSSFGKSNSRVIEDYTPPGGITPGIIFSTNKYWYNTFTFTAGIEKCVYIPKDLQLNYGLDLNNYFTFSQYYHITYPQPAGDDFKQSSSHYFGFSVNVTASLLKNFKRIKIGPTIFLPLFDNWKKDAVFPQENNNESRYKWLKGLGLGLSCNYSLSK